MLEYSFDRVEIHVSNECALDSAAFLTNQYVHFPYADRSIIAFGPSLSVNISTLQTPRESFEHGRITAFSIDQKFDRPTDGVDMWVVAGMVNDTTDHRPSLFELYQLQIRIERNGRLVNDWHDIVTKGVKAEIHGRGNISLPLLDDGIDVGETVKLSLRNRASGSALISFVIYREPRPLQPYLADWREDISTGVSHSMYPQQPERRFSADLHQIDNYYKYWPNSFAGQLTNGHFAVSSRVHLFFRKPSPNYVDSTMEYMLLTGNSDAEMWTSTGHLLTLPRLTSGKKYRLIVRYKRNPGSAQTYAFYTDPEWYQTRLLYWLIGGAIAIIALSFFLMKNRKGLKREKKKGRALQHNLQTIRAQLNPHFVFNALASIQSLMNKKDVDAANHYLSSFSDLLRQSLRNNDKELIPLDQEIQLLKTYLELEQLRFPFQYQLDVNKGVDTSIIEFPSLLLQPVIENAIRHAAGPLEEKGRLGIAFKRRGQALDVTVTDNGPGFDQQATREHGLGLRLTKERISLLNQALRSRKIDMYVGSTTKGTNVNFIFENWL